MLQGRNALFVVVVLALGGCATPLDPTEGPRAYMSTVGSAGKTSDDDKPPKTGCRLPAKLGTYEDELEARGALDGSGIVQASSIGDGPSWVSNEDRLIYGSSHVSMDPDDPPFDGEYKPGKYALPPREAKARLGVPPIELRLWAYDSDDSLVRLEIYTSVSGDLVIESVDKEKRIVKGHFENVAFKEQKEISDHDLVPNGCETRLERFNFTIRPEK